jgi:MoxR-like ATPase
VEKEILTSQLKHHPLNDISYVVKAMDIMQCQALVRQVHISDEVKDYIVRIVAETRGHQALAAGCSPRASLALMRLSQSLAAYYERDYVIPRDVRELAPAALGHRAQLKTGFRGKWANAGDVITEILEKVPVKGE